MNGNIVRDEIAEQNGNRMDTAALLEVYRETGDESIKWQIVLRCEKLVKNAVLQVRGVYSSFAQVEDMVNEGLLTILKSIDKFDPAKGVKFETYVSKRIRGMVIDQARKQDWIPRSIRSRAKELDGAVTELSNRLGRYPTGAEMAEYLNVTEERLQKELAETAIDNVLSLEALADIGESDNTSFQVASKDEQGMPDFVVAMREQKEVLTEAIARLQENEQIVISLYYVENLRLKDIAQVMDISEPRVSQLHTRAIRKLRKELAEYYNLKTP